MTGRYHWLDQYLSDDAIVITSSHRLARELANAHGQSQQAEGRLAWISPEIVWIGDWYCRLLDETWTDTPFLRIGQHISRVLWERALDGLIPSDIPGKPGIVRYCIEARSRMLEWCLPLETVEQAAYGGESRLFARAARRYAALLEKSNWLDEALWPESAIDLIVGGQAEVPARVNFVGFDRQTPQFKRLVEALAKRQCCVHIAEPAGNRGQLSLTRFHDQASEYRAAGQWARERLVENPLARIAVVCPDLTAEATLASRLIREGFSPGWQYGSEKHRRSVNVSFGRPLGEYPAIRDALSLLRWSLRELENRDVSLILRSPHILGTTIGERMRVELRMRNLPARRWSVGSFLDVFGDERAERLPHWSSRLKTIEEKVRSLPGRDTPSHLARTMNDLLALAEWPGTASLESEEFQLVNRWRELLNEFARLDVLNRPMSLDEAIERLASMAGQVIFQPEAEAGALPVIGALEASGLEFDALWICGFDENHWPPPGRPVAMLPYQLQRDCFMPDATPEDTLAFGRLVLNRLAASAGTVRFSFAASRDAVPQQLSPFATELGLEAVEGEVPDRHAEGLISVVSASRPAKDPVPPVGEGEKISGGAYTVQRQETDPFSAFAFGRLQVTELSPFYAGLSPPVRGSIIHTAAQALYAGLPSRNALQQWTARDVETRVEDASRRATDAYFRGADSVLRSLLKGERSRLQNLLRSLIECDLQRDDFTVHAVEREASLDRYGVLLSLRIDRLDATPDGTYVLVDYKTGQEKRLLNRNGEINDLQLVVYEMAVPLEVERLAIFNVDSRKTSFYSTAPDDDWDDLVGHWRERVDMALRNLARGHASVNLSLSTDQVRSYAILSRFEELRRD